MEITLDIGSIVTAILAFCGVYLINIYTKTHNQDSQTEWVSRLVKVATKTTGKTLNETTIYQILSTLRPFPFPNCDEDDRGFKNVTNLSIDYCQKWLVGKTGDVRTGEAKKIRLIANILLKYHWEAQDFQSLTVWYKLTHLNYKKDYERRL